MISLACKSCSYRSCSPRADNRYLLMSSSSVRPFRRSDTTSLAETSRPSGCTMYSPGARPPSIADLSSNPAETSFAIRLCRPCAESLYFFMMAASSRPARMSVRTSFAGITGFPMAPPLSGVPFLLAKSEAVSQEFTRLFPPLAEHVPPGKLRRHRTILTSSWKYGLFIGAFRPTTRL